MPLKLAEKTKKNNKSKGKRYDQNELNLIVEEKHDEELTLENHTEQDLLGRSEHEEPDQMLGVLSKKFPS